MPRCSKSRSPKPGPGAVSIHEFLVRETLTAVTVSDTLWDQMVVTDEEFQELGPAIQDLIMNVEIRNISALFELRVAVQRKYLDGDWLPAPADIASGDLVLSLQAANGFVVASPFSDRGRLGAMNIRLLLQWHVKSTGGGVAGAKADVSLSAFTRFFCG